MSLKKDIMWRMGLVYLLMLVFGLIIIGKVMWLQVVDKDEWEAKAITLRVHDIEPSRGNIYATDGRMLASSVPYYEVRLDTRSDGLTREVFFSGLDSLSLQLSRLFRDRTQQHYKRDLTKAFQQGKRYFLVKNHVTYNELKALKDFPVFRRGRFKGGVIYIQENKRFQPHVYLAQRTIGYLSKGQRGNVVGIEGAYDHHLKGVQGKRLMQRLSGGVWMPVSDENEVDPENGLDIVTCIDINIQDVAHSALLKQLQLHGAHHGTAVLMEVATGDIRAIVNLQKDRKGNYREIYNYAIGESSEPGSTFKLPALMAALEEGYVDMHDSVDTEKGVTRFYDKLVKDTKPGGFGKISVQEAFEISSNVGIAKVVDKSFRGKERQFVDRLYSMRLNQKLGVEIKGEGAPNIKYPDDKLWSGISLPMISHGYEVQLTPLQILTFYNAVANDGKMVKPRFVKQLRRHDKVIKNIPVELLHPSIASASTIRKAKIMLEGVVERGTATNLRNAYFKIAGKTGTAQINYTNREEPMSYQASFVGYFPADNPKYSCIVVVNAPTSDVYYGNLVAGPVFLEIANKVYATSLNMHDDMLVAVEHPADPPFSKCGYKPELDAVFSAIGCATADEGITGDWVITRKESDTIRYLNEKIISGMVPNVKEMGAKDALFLLENIGLKVEIVGRGKVVEQSLLPGTHVQKGDKIILEMSFT
ncbi:MAG: penicillin-binding protein [Bacteroidota bacterium]